MEVTPMWTLLSLAFAADALPGLVNPSAVPIATHHGQVDATLGGGLLSEGAGVATLQGVYRPGERIRIGAAAVWRHHYHEGEFQSLYDGALNLGVVVVDHERVSVVPWVAVGSYTQAGLAMWFGFSDRVSLDASWGYGLITRELSPFREPSWKALADPPPYFETHLVSYLPEFGVSVAYGAKRQHVFRLGHEGPLPMMQYRAELGGLSVEAQATYLVAGGALAFGVSADL